MKILFIDNIIRDITSEHFTFLPVRDQLGHLLSRGIADLPSEEPVPPAFQRLGIDSQDVEAYEKLKALCSKIHSVRMQIVPTKMAGIFHVCEATEHDPIMVFKIGHMRAAKETIVRKILLRLGLQQHIVPSIFAALHDPPVEALAKTVEELWNGCQKIFTKGDGTDTPPEEPSEASSESSLEMCDKWFLSVVHSEPTSLASSVANTPVATPHSSAPSSPRKKCTPHCSKARTTECTPYATPIKPIPQSKSAPYRATDQTERSVVGLLQPYVSAHKRPLSAYQLTIVTMSALAVGLRDAKEDGLVDDVFVDVDDCMPTRLDPPEEADWYHVVSATQLPFLERSATSKEQLSTEDVGAIARLVQAWDIDALIAELAQEKIVYEDKKAETFDPSGFDDGNCSVQVAEDKKFPHLINGRLNKDQKHNPERNIFTQNELGACRLRLERMKAFVESHASSGTSFCTQDLVFAVDPHAKMFYDALEKAPPTTLRKSVDAALRHAGPFRVIGQITPSSASIEEL